jgi:peptidyl-tRNA hydrolase, PTH1 family
MAVSWCIAGLGNPGKAYAATRHNIGFMVLDELAAGLRARWTVRKAYEYCDAPGWGSLLVKPMTYMNDSGPALRQFLAYRGLGTAQLLVICDDLNLPLGTLRLRPAGSDGGHNGLKSVIASLGSRDFARLRMGIGRNPGGVDSADYVLAPFSRSHLPDVRDMIGRAAAGVEQLAAAGMARAMNVINQNNQ